MDKAVLLKGFLPEADVELPSGIGTVRVRGLSRQEAVAVQRGVSEDDPNANDVLEVRAVARGILDPVLSEATDPDERIKEAEAAVAHWRTVGLAADVQAVAQRISQLSNMEKDSGKGPTSHSRRTRR